MFVKTSALVVALLHYGFAFSEIVRWDQMAARFGFSPEAAQTTRSLALNQGAYNAAVATVLVWAVLTGRRSTVAAMLLFVLAMAVVGALSVSSTIMVVQGVPALVALAAIVTAKEAPASP